MCTCKTTESWTTSGSLSSSFFEGWYYKIESQDGQTVVVIPGIIYGERDSFAFVMFSAPSIMGTNRRIALYRRVIQTALHVKLIQRPAKILF